MLQFPSYFTCVSDKSYSITFPVGDGWKSSHQDIRTPHSNTEEEVIEKREHQVNRILELEFFLKIYNINCYN